jgi:hypothetical protein
MFVFQFIAVLATTLFAAAAIYINVAEHPARMECGTAVAATVFGPSYRRAAVMQALLALTGTAGAIGARFAGAALAWLFGAELLDPAIDRSSDRVHRLLQRWGRLHAVLSVLALASSILFLASLVESPPKP